MATVTPIRPRKPNRRQGAIPAPALRNSTPQADARWLAALREDAGRRGLPPVPVR
jgi:hypothetical protein